MLQDYRNYIINIRNGLIQCGVDVSISPLYTYRELFYEADKLSQILWFYSVMGISGSSMALDDFFLDLSGYYKEKMRQKFYAEFQDYYDSYKHISKLAFLAGTNKTESSKMIEEEEEEFDLFGSEEVQGTVFGEDIDGSDDVIYEEIHGTFIDDLNIYSNLDKVLETGYIPAEISVNLTSQISYSEVHGVYLDEVDEVIPELAEPEEIHGVYLEDIDSDEYGYLEVDKPFEGDIHGIFLDDVEDDTYYSEEDEVYDDIQYSDEDDEYDDIHYSEDDEEEYDDIHYSDDDDEYDDIHYSEDDEDDYDDIHYSEDEDDEYDDIHYSEDEDDEYDDINYSDDEEDGYDDINYSDDDDEYDDIHYSDDEDDEYDDIHYSDDDDEPYDDIHYSDDDDFEEPRIHTPTVNSSGGTSSPPKKGDMSDILQSGVNNLLTKGKRFILSETRKLREGEQK